MNENAEIMKQKLKGTLKLLDEISNNKSVSLSVEDKALLFKADDTIRELRKNLIEKFKKKGWITNEEAEEFFKYDNINLKQDVNNHQIIIKNL